MGGGASVRSEGSWPQKFQPGRFAFLHGKLWRIDFCTGWYDLACWECSVAASEIMYLGVGAFCSLEHRDEWHDRNETPAWMQGARLATLSQSSTPLPPPSTTPPSSTRNSSTIVPSTDSSLASDPSYIFSLHGP